MNALPILPDDDPPSMPSLPTQWGGDPATLGRIDHYDLLRKLGGGGFGVVYLARDTASGIEVALKTLHPLLKHNAEEMDLLREKFRLVHGLTHPNIAKALVIHLVREINVWDAAARAELKLSSGDSVMVMDYAPGVTLSKWRRQFPDGIVPPDLALEVGRQVAEALDYAHSERIVHRDVKPGNIMVETLAAKPQALDHDIGKARSASAPTLCVRILDFGLAAEIRSSISRVSTETGDTSGTRPYMAPEQWLGKKQDGRSDQYALACVLYELLSGAPPFAGVFETGDPAVMTTAVEKRSPDFLPGLSRGANAALLRALAKDPAARFPSCTAFVEVLGGGRDASTKRPRRLAVAAAAVLALATGALWFARSRGGAEDSGRPPSAATVPESYAESAETESRAEPESHTESAEGAEPEMSPFSSSPPPAARSESELAEKVVSDVLNDPSFLESYDGVREAAKKKGRKNDLPSVKVIAFDAPKGIHTRSYADAVSKALNHSGRFLSRPLFDARPGEEDIELQNAFDYQVSGLIRPKPNGGDAFVLEIVFTDVKTGMPVGGGSVSIPTDGPASKAADDGPVSRFQEDRP